MTPNRPSDSGRRAARWCRVDAIKDRWQHGDPPDAVAVLDADSELRQDKQIVLDLAYEEYCLQQEGGVAPPVEEFADRFPDYRQSLLRLLAVHSFIRACPDTGPSITWPQPDELLAEFRIVRQLGRGGFAHVYLARETTAGNRPVVLKVSADGLSEADTLGPMAHPHIMGVLAARRIGDLSVIVMPFLGAATLEEVAAATPADGRALREVCRTAFESDDPPVPDLHRPSLRPDRSDQAIAAIGAEVADSLAFLHAKGYAHQDLKPSNVLLTPSGYSFLLDFNLTAQASQDRGTVGGTVPYMAPEQLATFCTPGARPTYDRCAADVYSLGLILYELLAGRHPFPANPGLVAGKPSRETVAARHRPPAPLAVVNPAVDAALAEIVTECLATNPTARPPAAAVAERLRRAATPPEPPKSQWRSAALALLATVAMTLGFFWPSPHTAFEQAQALLNVKQYDAAGKRFQDVGQASNDRRAYAFAAYSYSLGHLDGSAITCANKALELGCQDVSAYCSRANSYQNRGEIEKAWADCEAAIRQKDDCLEARYLRANLALARHRANPEYLPGPDILADIERVCREGPPAPEVSLLAARLYATRNDAGSLSAAVSAVREAIARGMPPADIKRMRELVAKLKDREDFQAAMAGPVGPKGTAKMPTLVKPQ